MARVDNISMNTLISADPTGSADSPVQLWPAGARAANSILWEQERLCRPLSREELLIRGGMPEGDRAPAA